MENLAANPQILKHPLKTFEDLLRLIGDDPKREGLLETPARVLKSYSELFRGYSQDPADILSKTFDAGPYDEMVILKQIDFFSTCEHHLLPFFGTISIGYVPKDRVVGLSKLARVAECFAKRLQIQERLTTQIANAIEEHLEPKGVGVVVKAQHLCMLARGVQKKEPEMVTSSLMGVFREPAVRAEFLTLINGKH